MRENRIRTSHSAALLAVLLLPAAALRENITGTVTNGTTGKPAAGVAVTLVDPMGGMAEIATPSLMRRDASRSTLPPLKGHAWRAPRRAESTTSR